MKLLRALALILLLSVLTHAQSGGGYAVSATGYGLSVVVGPGTTTTQSGTIVPWLGGLINVPANTTTYVYLDNTGTIQTSTSGFGTSSIPLAVVTSDRSKVLTVKDSRSSYNITNSIGPAGIPSTLPNCTATGTVFNEGVEFSLQVVGGVNQVCGQTSQIGSQTTVAVCSANCGNSGVATLIYSGLGNVILDGSGLAGDYVIPSSNSAGQFTDIGGTKPSGTVETFGIITIPNTGAGTLAQVYVQPLSLFASGATNNAGNVNNAPQLEIPYYSGPGSSNVLSGDFCTTDGSGNMTCHTYTSNGPGTGFISTLIGPAPTPLPTISYAKTFVNSSTNQLDCELSTGFSCAPTAYYLATGNGLKCDGSTDDTSAFNTLLTAIGSAQATIQIPLGKKCVIGNATVPTNVALDFSSGASISVVTSDTVTIKGGINDPDNHQIFFNAFASQGTVDVTTNNTALTTVYPEWWGAVAGGNSTTNQSAIQAAIIGAYGSNRTNGSGNDIFNRELRFSGQYSVNGTLNVYHMIGFVWNCANRNGCGLTETSANHTLINGQSVAYGVFRDMTFATTQAQNASSPLVSLDYNASQGTDIAIQFIDFDHDNFSGAQQGQIGVQIAASGGTAQGSNITFTNNQFTSFNQACLMIGNGSNGTPSASATNAISIRVAGGDFSDCNAYGVANYGGGLLDINGTTFEDGLDSTISGARAQTGYDMFCYIAVSGEFCTAENVRSESLWLVGGFDWILNNVYNLDQIHVLDPGATPAVGGLIQGHAAADGVYYQVTGSTSAASGLGTTASPLTASGGSGTTIVDSVGGFTVNAWTGWQVSYVTPGSSLQYCVITSNTANTFTCSAGWQDRYLNQTIANPINGTQYIVEPNWGTQTTSGGITWAALTKMDLGCSACGGVVNAVMNGVFIPGVQIGGPQIGAAAAGNVSITSTRADAFSLSGQGYNTYTGNNERVVVTAGLSGAGPAGGSGQINLNYIRKPLFYQTSSTGIPGGGAAVGSANGMAFLHGEQRQDCWIGGPTNGANNLGTDICTGVSVSTPNTGTWYVDNASASSTPKRLSFDPNGILKTSLYATTGNCAAVGTAANPSVAACSAAPAGAVSCATNASTGTCTVNTTAVTANSEIFVQQITDTTTGTRLSVTCNTTKDTNSTSPQITARSAGTSFTFQLGTFNTNPECFNYFIVN